MPEPRCPACDATLRYGDLAAWMCLSSCGRSLPDAWEPEFDDGPESST